MKNAKKMKKKERERREEEEQFEYFPMFVHALFSIFFYSSRSSLITRILLAFLVNQSANSGERANDSKAAFVDPFRARRFPRALKNLPRELLARPTGGIRFLSFPLELLVVVENGGGDFFYPHCCYFLSSFYRWRIRHLASVAAWRVRFCLRH